jgi:dihydropteroate synthase
MIKDGADFIDIGAQSTRPNAEFLSARRRNFKNWKCNFFN